MDILKRNGFLLLLVIISCFSFAQKKKIISYTRGGAITIIFYDDSTFLHRVTNFCGFGATEGYSIRDTINYGTYIKEKGRYILTSALEICHSDSVIQKAVIKRKKSEKDSITIAVVYPYPNDEWKDTILCKGTVTILNKKKIILDDIVFQECEYYHKKEAKRNAKKPSPRSYYRRLERQRDNN